jgi:molybdate transport system substrate-binding protein
MIPTCHRVVAPTRQCSFLQTFRELLRQEPALECWAMHTRLLFLASITSLAGTLCLVPAAAAQTSSVHLLVSNGLKGSMENLQTTCEASVGHPLDIRYNSTASVKKTIEAGERFDVTMITTEAIEDLVKQGKLAGDSKMSIGRSELGIGIKSGVPKPDIKTVDGLKKALLEVKSITYPQDGASRGYIEKMFERLGIATQVKPKIILAPGSGPATQSVADGKAGFVITLFSEILPIKGVDILGALPGEFQSDIKFSAAASTAASDKQAAKAVIACVTGSKATSVLKAKGIDRK